MQFEDLDKKIREAAEQHHPAYDEKAWSRMLKMLNKHLPEARADKRRTILLLLLLFLLIGGGTLFFVFRSNNSGTSQQAPQLVVKNDQQPDAITTANDKNIPVTSATPNTDPAVSTATANTTNSVASTVAGDKLVKQANTGVKANSLVAFDVDQSAAVRKQKKDKNTNDTRSVINNDKDVTIAVEPGNITTSKNSVTTSAAVTTPDANTNTTAPSVADKKESTNNVAVKEEKKDANENKIATPENKTDDKKEAAAAKKQVKKNNGDGFALTVSLGPDISKAGSSSMGKTTLAYGAGISYTKGRFTLHSGVYGGRKVYGAEPGDYKTSYSPPNGKLNHVDANCYIIEVPVKLSYAFANNDKGNFFAGAGLSSYFMKSEKYKFFYTGNPPYSNWTYSYSVKNENTHLFSVLDLSAGYTLHLSKSLTFTAEPYVGIPLHGVGVGHVRLANGGVLFSLGLRPFPGSTKKK